VGARGISRWLVGGAARLTLSVCRDGRHSPGRTVAGWFRTAARFLRPPWNQVGVVSYH